MTKSLVASLAVLIAVAVTAPADATLTTIGSASYDNSSYNLIWDADSPFGSIIWLDFNTEARGYGYQRSLIDTLNSVSVMSYSLNPGYAISWGDEGWRLPRAAAGDQSGEDFADSELGHLYYKELGNRLFQGGAYGPLHAGPFQHLSKRYEEGEGVRYWTETPEYVESDGTRWLYYFDFYSGVQSSQYDGWYAYGMPVRDAYVERLPEEPDPNPVPEPSTFLLAGAGAACLMLWRKRKA